MRGTLSLALVLVAGCGGLPSSPEDAFDAYLEAYADGEAQRLWELSAPEARADARRLKAELVALLTHEDAVERVKVEGLFGVMADDLEGLGDKEFFVWAVGAIRRRIGGPFIRKTVSKWERLGVRHTGPHSAIVIFREAPGQQGKLVVRELGSHWYVVTSPFPQEKAQK